MSTKTTSKKRGLFRLLGLAALIFGMLGAVLVAPSNAQLSGSPVSVLLDGRLLRFDVPPIEVNGRVLVPLRGVFEALGATVDYDNATDNIFATLGDTHVQLRLGSTDASINGTPRVLDVPAQSRLGRTLVPLRFVSEALGAVVAWNPAQRAVHISTDSGTVVAEPDNAFPPAATHNNELTTIQGAVMRYRARHNAFDIKTSDGNELTVQLDEALPQRLAVGDNVEVSGTLTGKILRAHGSDLRFVGNASKLVVRARVTAVLDDKQLTVTTRDGVDYTVRSRQALDSRLGVGDTVSVEGRAVGNAIIAATVTLVKAARDADAGSATPPDSQPVAFVATVEAVDAQAGWVRVRGDNNKVYTVLSQATAGLSRGDRVRIVGSNRNGVTTASKIIRQ